MPISETGSVALAVNAHDGIVFDPASVGVEEIHKEAGYAAARVWITGHLKKARCLAQVDIGLATPSRLDIAVIARWLLKRCQQRQHHRFKAREGFGKIWLEVAVNKGEKIAGVLGLDLRVATGLPERAREHRQYGRSPVQPGLEFLVT